MFNYTNTDPQSDEEPLRQEAEESQAIQLAIKLNEESSEFECAVCGDERISAKGPEIFLADSWDLVCDECGRKYAPLLMALMDLGAAAEGYAAVLDVAQLPDGEE